MARRRNRSQQISGVARCRPKQRAPNGTGKPNQCRSTSAVQRCPAHYSRAHDRHQRKRVCRGRAGTQQLAERGYLKIARRFVAAQICLRDSSGRVAAEGQFGCKLLKPQRKDFFRSCVIERMVIQGGQGKQTDFPFRIWLTVCVCRTKADSGIRGPRNDLRFMPGAFLVRP